MDTPESPETTVNAGLTVGIQQIDRTLVYQSRNPLNSFESAVASKLRSNGDREFPFLNALDWLRLVHPGGPSAADDFAKNLLLKGRDFAGERFSGFYYLENTVAALARLLYFAPKSAAAAESFVFEMQRRGVPPFDTLYQLSCLAEERPQAVPGALRLAGEIALLWQDSTPAHLLNAAWSRASEVWPEAAALAVEVIRAPGWHNTNGELKRTYSRPVWNGNVKADEDHYAPDPTETMKLLAGVFGQSPVQWTEARIFVADLGHALRPYFERDSRGSGGGTIGTYIDVAALHPDGWIFGRKLMMSYAQKRYPVADLRRIVGQLAMAEMGQSEPTEPSSRRLTQIIILNRRIWALADKASASVLEGVSKVP